MHCQTWSDSRFAGKVLAVKVPFPKGAQLNISSREICSERKNPRRIRYRAKGRVRARVYEFPPLDITFRPPKFQARPIA